MIQTIRQGLFIQVLSFLIQLIRCLNLFSSHQCYRCPFYYILYLYYIYIIFYHMKREALSTLY